MRSSDVAESREEEERGRCIADLVAVVPPPPRVDEKLLALALPWALSVLTLPSLRALDAGRLYGQVHQGLWFDVGTPAAIGRTEALLADG